MPQNVASEQDLHCLFTVIPMQTTIPRMVVQGQLDEPALCFSDLQAFEILIHSLIKQKPSTSCLDRKLFLIFMTQKLQFMIFSLANDHFIVWLPSVTLTFNLSDQMFQTDNWAKLFWNPCINVEVMAQDKLNLWPFYRLIFKYDLDLQPTWTNVSNGTSAPQG